MRRPPRALPLVDAWFDLLPPVQQPLARHLHELITAAAPQLTPAVKWGTLAYLCSDGALLTLAPLRHHLQLQVAHGAALVPQFPELEGAARVQRYLRLRYSQPVDQDLVRELVLAAQRLGLPRRSMS